MIRIAITPAAFEAIRRHAPQVRGGCASMPVEMRGSRALDVVIQSLTSVIIAVPFSVSGAMAGAFEDCVANYRKQDYAAALQLCRPLAEQGNAVAQAYLGLLFADGHGVTQDYSEAMKWYRAAADRGLATAQLNLGIMYENGEGVTQDYVEAVKWYRIAAERGDARSKFRLGLLYEDGHGVTQDYAEAMRWYRAAAEQGDALAQASLGFLYGQPRRAGGLR
ncbi:MAG TPA: tetratricopeptide repeat protein [Roseiarcus sp.]|nr:tetratricopeptide repeat protein [Roseiarcus sp.]